MSHFHSIQESRRGIAREASYGPVTTGWFHAIAAWLGRRRLRQDLSDLDDRLLDDVGIPREVVRQLGKSAWWP
jgi:uncharacterized protein YjiS (DUF1127 family)